MIRTLNVVAILALIGSATMAYQVKYETILINEKVRKSEVALQREKDAIAVLKAEWELLNRPSRLAMLAQPEAGMQTLTVRQIAKAGDVPKAQPKSDALDSILTGSLPAGDAARKITPRPATSALAATPRPQPRTGAVTPRPDPRAAAPKAATVRVQPRTANAAPMALRPPANLGATRGTGQSRDPIAAVLRPPQPVQPPRR